MGWHVALVNPDQTETYLGVVEDLHVGQVLGIGGAEESNRWVKRHPRKDDEFFVIRDDGLLEWYVEEGAVPEDDGHQTEPGAGEELVGAAEPRGASGPSYISGVERLGDQSIGGSMDYPGNPPRVVHHTTESGSGSGVFTSMASYLIRVSSEPQVLYDPSSDRLGQFGPLNQSARALRNESNGRRTNREGKVCIQIEVCARAAKPWTSGWDPAKKPNYQKLIAAIRAWGVPDTWPAGALAKTYGSSTSRSSSTWHGKGGHYGHCNVPGNDHWDPGNIDKSKILYKAGGGTTKPPSSGTYTVRKGDTLWSIAQLYDTTVANLVALNKLTNPNRLDVGQVLKVPAAKQTLYTVKKGDTLWGIAQKYKTSVSKLKSENGLKSDLIDVGQVLKIPS